MGRVYFSCKNTIVWYLKTNPGDSHRLNSPPMRVDPRTEGENWLLNNRRAGLGISPRYHMSGVERGDDSVLFLSTNINNPPHSHAPTTALQPFLSQLTPYVRSTYSSIHSVRSISQLVKSMQWSACDPHHPLPPRFRLVRSASPSRISQSSTESPPSFHLRTRAIRRSPPDWDIICMLSTIGKHM